LQYICFFQYAERHASVQTQRCIGLIIKRKNNKAIFYIVFSAGKTKKINTTKYLDCEVRSTLQIVT